MKPSDLPTCLLAVESWAPAARWALRQTEESFCDFVGLRIFGTSFLEAFAYLLSPKAGPRSVFYPNMRTRVENLQKAAQSFAAAHAARKAPSGTAKELQEATESFAIGVPSEYTEQFEDDKATGLTLSGEFRASVADGALAMLVGDLITEADDVLNKATIPMPSVEEVRKIYARLKRVVPAEGCTSLANILNAAWQAFGHPDLWIKIPQVQKDRDRILKDLVLKNLEVFEIEQILKESA